MAARSPARLSAPPPVHLYTVDGTRVAVTVHEPTPDPATVPEAFVQDLWHERRYAAEDLRTTDGRRVQVFDPGCANTDAGPDFVNAHVRIGDIEWRGDVEIHVTSRGWVDHAHDTDARYNSVVLHVALQADAWTGNLHREDASSLPETILLPHVRAPLRALLHAFHTRAEDALPCAPRWEAVPSAVRTDWIRRLARRRMNAKRDRLARREAPSLAARLHERLFAGLGYAKNDAPMTTLARHLPLPLVAELDDPRDLEALHLGTAGLIPDPAQSAGSRPRDRRPCRGAAPPVRAAERALRPARDAAHDLDVFPASPHQLSAPAHRAGRGLAPSWRTATHRPPSTAP